MSKYRVEKCRSCGAEIIWIQTDSGAHIPVNKTRAHGYIINDKPPGTQHAHSAGLFHVSHFISCPQASRWSTEKAAANSPDERGTGKEEAK